MTHAVIAEWGSPELLIPGFQKHGRTGPYVLVKLRGCAAEAYRSARLLTISAQPAKTEAPRISNPGRSCLNRAGAGAAIGRCA